MRVHIIDTYTNMHTFVLMDLFILGKKRSNKLGNPEKEKMELEESGSLTSDYTTKLQSSKQYLTGTKPEI